MKDISLNDLASLADMAKKLQARGQEMDVVRELLTEISSTMADLLEHCEGRADPGKSVEQAMQAMTKALGELRAPAITVSPTPVEVHVAAAQVTVPPAQVVVKSDAAKGWDFEVVRDHRTGALTGMRAKRID